MQVRPYQQQALDKIREYYGLGIKRVLLHMATGGGKTVVFSVVMRNAAAKGKRCIMVVRGKDLVDQASQRLIRENVDHGCLQADHWNKRPKAPIQICSIDTLYRRKLTPPADLIVIDEAHLATSNGFRWLVEQYPNAFYLPVSATPHVKGGLRHIASAVVRPITFLELVQQGFLVPPRYYRPPGELDLSRIAIDAKTRDYEQVQLDALMTGSQLVGDLVAHYRRIVDGLPAVCFGVSVKHSIMIRDTFNAAGIAAEHVEAETADKDRRAALERLATGKTKVICNVGILCTGVDMPWLRAVIMARPTKSYNLYIQQLGRGTRPFQDKQFFYVLDHANNVAEHGLMEYERECDLDGKRKPESTPKPLLCKECFGYYEPTPIPGKRAKDYRCPYCGCDNAPQSQEPRERKVESLDGELKELSSEEIKREIAVCRIISQAVIYSKEKPTGNYRGWAFHRIVKQLGKDYAERYWKRIKREIPKPAQSA